MSFQSDPSPPPVGLCDKNFLSLSSGLCGLDLYPVCTEVQLLSFVCSTGRKGSKPRLWNIQNLGPVPPYAPLGKGKRKKGRWCGGTKTNEKNCSPHTSRKGKKGKTIVWTPRNQELEGRTGAFFLVAFLPIVKMS